MSLSLMKLRTDLYKVIDQIIETGNPIEVIRNGHKIKIILADRPTKLERLVRRENIINGDRDSIIHNDWVSKWTETKKTKREGYIKIS